jgi:hypothetical protein
MNNKWLILINPLIAIMMLSQSVTALNYYFAFLDRKTFLTLHLYGGYILSGLVLIHLIINWFWVKNTFIKKKKAAKKPPQKKQENPSQEVANEK